MTAAEEAFKNIRAILAAKPQAPLAPLVQKPPEPPPLPPEPPPDADEERYHELLARIVKGAEFIDSLDKADPKYSRAMDKLNSLEQEIDEIKRRKGWFPYG
jgi:hypothetical protein